MANTEKYAKDMHGLIEQINALDKALAGSGYGFKLTEVINAHGSLFDRFCPFKVGDRVQLSRDPEISAKTSWGWLGARHFLVAGAKAGVVSRGYRDEMFYFGLVFDDESWITIDGRVNPLNRSTEFTFGEDFVEAVSDEK